MERQVIHNLAAGPGEQVDGLESKRGRFGGRKAVAPWQGKDCNDPSLEDFELTVFLCQEWPRCNDSSEAV